MPCICRGGERRRCRLVHTASRPPQGGVDAEGVGWRGAQTSGARFRRRASASRSARQPPLPATMRCRVRRPLCCGPPGAALRLGAAAEGVPWLLLGAGPPGDSDLRAAMIACVRASAASTCPCVRRGIPAHTLYLHSLVLHAAGAPAKPRTCPWSCGRSQPPEGSCSFAWPGVHRNVDACGWGHGVSRTARACYSAVPCLRHGGCGAAGGYQQNETALLMEQVCKLVGGCSFVVNTGDNLCGPPRMQCRAFEAAGCLPCLGSTALARVPVCACCARRPCGRQGRAA